MKHRLAVRTIVLAATISLLPVIEAQPAPKVTAPKEQFGFNIGDDYHLVTHSQFTEYLQKLDRESDRLQVVSIGKTAEGRDQPMAIVTAPENFKKLDRYKEISRRLALTEGLTDDQARALAAEGKAIVWIDGGLHATEVLGAQQLLETIYQVVSRNDEETRRFLRDVIVLFVHANPDGHVMVADSYMSNKEPSKRRTSIPYLYQKYTGHDNNRDFYMVTQAETINMTRQLFHVWFPQIMYNHHQSGPAGTVMAGPPYRDPFSYFFDPLIPVGLNLVAASMHNRMALEGKAGFTMDQGSTFSFWYNGGLRTITYFHNIIGVLTETIGSPTPMEIPFVPDRQLANSDTPFPIAPQKWPFRQSIEYSLTANLAILDVASRHREQFLFNIYQMGKNSIERGSRDHWTVTPSRLDKAKAAIAKDRSSSSSEQSESRRPTMPSPASAKHFALLRDPALRDPRGYILPADQPDFLTATKFVNTLIHNGVTVLRATASFEAGGKKYPSGSYVVKTAQAFRPHILDMFEPQDYPNEFQFPGGPPVPPYDLTGWTLAYQMGVAFDRILEGFEGPFEKIDGLARPPQGAISGAANPAGYVFSGHVNDSFLAVNRLLKGGAQVSRLKQGDFYVAAEPSVLPVLRRLAAEAGLNFQGVAATPEGQASRLRPARIALWDRYGGSMPSGWTRWLLEQYEFTFEVVFPKRLDEGNLRAQFDVLILPDGAMGGFRGGFGPPESSAPQEYQHMTGNITNDRTVPKLKEFLDSGGAILTIGSSTALAERLRLPVANHLTERQPSGEDRAIPRERFYVPGSVLQARVDTTHPLAYGLGETVHVMFQSSPVFRLRPNAAAPAVRPVVWFDSATPLRSGWAWGQQYLKDGVAVAEAPVGEGKLILYGPEVIFRAQPHGTFKLLFNGIYY